jgi:hypothetical protein
MRLLKYLLLEYYTFWNMNFRNTTLEYFLPEYDPFWKHTLVFNWSA